MSKSAQFGRCDCLNFGASIPFYRKYWATSPSKFIYCNASNKRPDAYLVFQIWGGRLFEVGRLFEAKIWGHLFNNPVSRVGVYSRGGRLIEALRYLARGFHISKFTILVAFLTLISCTLVF